MTTTQDEPKAILDPETMVDQAGRAYDPLIKYFDIADLAPEEFLAALEVAYMDRDFSDAMWGEHQEIFATRNKFMGQLKFRVWAADPESLLADQFCLVEERPDRNVLWSITLSRSRPEIEKHSNYLAVAKQILGAQSETPHRAGGVIWYKPGNPYPIPLLAHSCDQFGQEFMEARFEQLKHHNPKPMVEPDHLPPETEAMLLEHQRRPARILINSLRNFNYGLDASQTGLGKTYVAMACKQALGRPALVICPKNIMTPWKECAEAFGEEIEVINWEMIRTGRTKYASWHEPPKKNQRWRFRFELPEDYLLIFDEVHHAAGLTSYNSDILIGATKQNYTRLMLSATACQDPTKMKAIGFSLGLHQLADYYKWAQFHGASIKRSRPHFDQPKHMVDRHLKKIHKSIFGMGKGVRMKKTDIPDAAACDLQSDAWNFDDETTGSIREVYKEMHAELEALKQKAKQDRPSILTIILRARQQIEILKTPGVAQMAKELMEEGHSVPIFVNFDATIDSLTNRLGTDCIVRGGQSSKRRDEVVRRFASNESKLIICNIEAGGQSINLQDTSGEHPRVALIMPGTKAVSLLQAMGRIDRATSRSDSINRIIWCANTEEERLAKSLRSKTRNISLINDADLSGEVIIDTSSQAA